ncbi:hypothetical protein QBC32DRAFT_206931, partial [Pseudoneurospora amorphoporcata]
YSHHTTNTITNPAPFLVPLHPSSRKMCKITYNETKCTSCKTLLKSEIDRDTCYEVLASSTLTFGGCKDGATSVTNTKEEGICDACTAKARRVQMWRGAAMG